MKELLKIYQYARKRFLQSELNKLTDIEKDKEICIMIAFMTTQGISKNYALFKYAIVNAQKDFEIIKAMKDEINEFLDESWVHVSIGLIQQNYALFTFNRLSHSWIIL